LKNQSENPVFLQKSGKGKSKESVSSISLSDLIYFFKNPVQWYMKEGLDIKIPDMEEQTVDREVFTLSGLDQYNMGSFLVEQNLRLPGEPEEPGEEDYYPVLKAMGTLPLGQKGKLEYENITAFASPVINAARSIAAKKQLPAIAGEVNVNTIMVSENLSGINEDGAYYVSYGKLNGSRLFTAWLRHLFINLTAPDDYPKDTTVIGRDPAGKKDLLTYMFPSLKSDALQYFKNLVQIYTKGGDQLFYFASETSWQLVQILSKSRFDLDRDTVFKAMSSFKVKNSWYGGYNRKGEKDNRYISLCVENSDPFESVDALLASGFVENSIMIYKPMLENMKIIS
jgi:exodeoxyribonuclease V gamma subunit